MAGIPGLRPVAATLGTLLVVFVSWRAWQGAEFGDVSVLALMAVGVLTVPLLLAADAAEFALQGAMVGVHLPPVESVRQVSRANVANLLPLPGGPVLRQRVLSTRGAGQRSAARAQLITGIWWLACGLTVSGLALMAAADRWWIGGLALLGGLGFGGIGWTVRPRAATSVQLGSLALVELAKVVIGTTRRSRARPPLPWESSRRASAPARRWSAASPG